MAGHSFLPRNLVWYHQPHRAAGYSYRGPRNGIRNLPGWPELDAGFCPADCRQKFIVSSLVAPRGTTGAPGGPRIR